MASMEVLQHSSTAYYLMDKWDRNLSGEAAGSLPAGLDLLTQHNALENLLESKDWDTSAKDRVRLAERVMLEAMEGMPVRYDGSLAQSHNISVAMMIVQWGGNADDVALTLLHNTIPDHQDIQNAPLTIEVIADLFGESMATSVEGLTDAKSINNVDLETRTHHKLFELIKTNPRALAVKLAYRLQYMRTREMVPVDERIQKAHESLDIYTRLATALGFHGVANEIATSSLEDISMFEQTPTSLKFPDSYYQHHVQTFAEYLHQLDDEHRIKTVSHARAPTLFDAYKSTLGSVESIPRAHVPISVAVVIPENGHTDDSGSIHIDRWKEKVSGIADAMFRDKLLPESALNELHTYIRPDVSSVRVRYLHQGIPVQLIFLRESEDLEWRATVFDTESLEVQKKAIAVRKIHNLQRTYELFSDPRNMSREIEDAIYLFGRGAISFKDKDGNDIGLARRSSLVDAIFQIPHVKLRKATIGARITYEGQTFEEFDLSEKF